jgi:hypothetical protein
MEFELTNTDGNVPEQTRENMVTIIKNGKYETLVSHEKKFKNLREWINIVIRDLLYESAGSGDVNGIKKWMGLLISRNALTRAICEQTSRNLKNINSVEKLVEVQVYVKTHKPKLLGIFE